MITGLHAMMHSPDAGALRAFFRDVLGLPYVDVGHGWLIFKAPPTELATHPTEGAGSWELGLMCDDIEATVAELEAKGVACSPLHEEGWGRGSFISLPDGQRLRVYQPRYQTAI